MGLYIRTYADKSNTIVRCSTANLSLNPLIELNHGNTTSRGMIHFPHDRVKRLLEDGTYGDITKLRHILRMTNSASVNERNINKVWTDSQNKGVRMRAASYRLVLFLIPKEWDGGKGFDYNKDLYNEYGRGFSTEGANWYFSRSHVKWDEEGIYSTDTLSKYLDLYTAGAKEDNPIIGYERFEMGNEPLKVDVTETFNKFLTGDTENYGFGIAFSPMYEDVDDTVSQYTAFFSGHTNSFYEPFIETFSTENVADDRLNFCNGRENRLYFFTSANGQPVNLDFMPSANINGVPYDVKKTTKGAYYIEVNGDGFDADTMYYDTWTNLYANGHALPDTEMSFVPKTAEGFMTLGKPTSGTAHNFEPYVYGITHKERIKRGDIRKVTIDCKIPYTSDQTYTENTLEYRLYTKNGEIGDIDIIGYTPTERAYDSNYFLVDTESLIPSRYHIDVKVRYGHEEIIHRDILQFDIVGDETEREN